MKKSKITGFDIKKPFKGQKSAFVGLEDKAWGFYEYSGEPDFKIDDEVEYEIEVTKSENDKEVHKLTLHHVSETQQKEVKKETKATLPPMGNTSTIKCQATVKAMEFLVDMFIADKITWDQIQPKHKELTGYLNDAIDECNA